MAVSLRIIERQTVRSAADYAFKLAKRLGTHVTSSSKWTIQRATDGLFDGSREALQFVLPAMPAGEHVVTVQAWDELENVGVAQILVEIQP